MSPIIRSIIEGPEQPDRELVSLCRDIANGERRGEHDTQLRIFGAGEDHGFPRHEVDQRWQYAEPGDLRKWQGVYFVITGKRAPSRGGYAWA